MNEFSIYLPSLKRFVSAKNSSDRDGTVYTLAPGYPKYLYKRFKTKQYATNFAEQFLDGEPFEIREIGSINEVEDVG